MTKPREQQDLEAEEYPPRSQWTERERELLKTQTISQMYRIACVPEHFSLVFRNIAHRGGWKEVLSAEYDQLWRELAEWVSSLGDRRRDQYNQRIMERNKERAQLASELAAKDAEIARLREALEVSELLVEVLENDRASIDDIRQYTNEIYGMKKALADKAGKGD